VPRWATRNHGARSYTVNPRIRLAALHFGPTPAVATAVLFYSFISFRPLPHAPSYLLRVVKVTEIILCKLHNGSALDCNQRRRVIHIYTLINVIRMVSRWIKISETLTSLSQRNDNPERKENILRIAERECAISEKKLSIIT